MMPTNGVECVDAIGCEQLRHPRLTQSVRRVKLNGERNCHALTDLQAGNRYFRRNRPCLRRPRSPRGTRIGRYRTA